MQTELTVEQAAQITDLESYKTVTGAKRFKRTKEEMTIGLSPEEALYRRLAILRGSEVQVKTEVRASTSRVGDVTLKIRPAAKTDADYFEHIPGKPVELVLDQNWYLWFDELADGAFEGDTTKLFQYILTQGIEQVITRFHFPSDIEEFERPIRTPEQVT